MSHVARLLYSKKKKKNIHVETILEVEIRTLVALDTVKTVDVVVVAEEVEAEVPMRPCLGRHLK